MANTLASITTDLKTFGRVLLSEMRANLVLARLVTSGDNRNASIVGNKVTFPDVDVAGDASIRAIGGAATASDLIATDRTLTVEQIYKAVTVDNLENLFSSVDLMQRAASRLAYKVVKKADGIIAGLWNQMPYEVGELDGTGAFNATDKHTVLARALKVLEVNEVPTDRLVGVFNPQEILNMRSLDNLFHANEAGGSDYLRTQRLGTLLGVDIYESSQIASNFASVAAESASPGSVTGVNALGATTLVMGGLGAGTLQAGTSFSIAGFAKQYIVTTDATITANAATPAIYPALEAATAGAEAITFIEHVTATSSQNFVFHPDAIRAISMAASPFREGSGVASVIVSDPSSGLQVRVASESKLLGGAGVAYSESLSVDLVFGAAVVRPEWAVRITGQA